MDHEESALKETEHTFDIQPHPAEPVSLDKLTTSLRNFVECLQWKDWVS
jgi:hypothetical protein